MAKKEKVQQQSTDVSTADPGNIVVVAFNAGTGIIGVNQNPVIPAWLPDGRVRVTWDLTGVALPPGFMACFGNIVLSDFRDAERIAEKIEGEENKYIDVRHNPALNQWVWTYTPKGKSFDFQVHYDIFCVFGHEEVVGSRMLANDAGRHHHKVMSMRQSVGVDPTLVTPPGG